MAKLTTVNWYRWFLRNRARFDFLISVSKRADGSAWVIMSTDEKSVVEEWASFTVAEKYFRRAQKRVGYKLSINTDKQELLGDWATWNKEVWGNA